METTRHTHVTHGGRTTVAMTDTMGVAMGKETRPTGMRRDT